MLCKNVEDEARAVEHLDSGQALLQVSHLGTRKVVVEHDHLGVLFFEGVLDFVHLAFADKRCRAKILYALQKALHHLGSSSLGEPSQFGELFSGEPRAYLGCRNAYENAALFFGFVLCYLLH